MIMVDEVMQWPTKISCFKKGSCHLTVDGFTDVAITELHAFAKRIGMRRAWFQGKETQVPHYDLTPARRERALAYGAVFVPAKQQARDRIRKRAEYLLSDPCL